MSFAKDFKAFIMRGNVVDLAVAVVIGGAFGKVVSSLVSDIIMPPLGVITGGIDFSKMKVIIQSASGTTKEVAITYGAFVNAVITFLIIALAIFIVIKALEHVMPKKTDAPPPAPPADVVLLTEIRDLLKQQQH
ncbi:MAG TPA: large-conductance mechanosensitive channel protein MscL [Rhodanobacteraceae bacterium]|nr:large-conductance mechanosensitive channel protein MscL [Rhodanobacteraceae bacterium]